MNLHDMLAFAKRQSDRAKVSLHQYVEARRMTPAQADHEIRCAAAIVALIERQILLDEAFNDLRRTFPCQSTDSKTLRPELPAPILVAPDPTSPPSQPPVKVVATKGSTTLPIGSANGSQPSPEQTSMLP